MEVEKLVRYQFPVVLIVFNNGGVYGGDRRSPGEITGPYKDDPGPTFVPHSAYHSLIEAFGGKGYRAGTPEELNSALSESFSARKPAVINKSSKTSEESISRIGQRRWVGILETS
ncbi:unnamed protein product [Musa acuminata subsp. burmannicoides]